MTRTQVLTSVRRILFCMLGLGSVSSCSEGRMELGITESRAQPMGTLVLRSVTPKLGPTSGGIPVQIDGDGFTPGAAVQIGTAMASHVSVVTPTRIIAVLPPQSKWWGQGFEHVPVSVVLPDGRIVISNELFGYYAAQIQFSKVEVVATAKEYIHAFFFDDFNGDKHSDLVYFTDNGSPAGVGHTLLGNGQGGFAVPQTSSLGTRPNLFAVTGDFNGDDRLDVVARTSTIKPFDGVSLFLSDGAGGFTVPASFIPGNYAGAIAAGDFNLDQKLDLAIVEGSDLRMVKIWLGDGTGQFVTAGAFFAGRDGLLSTGDFNGDGKPDLVLANSDYSNIYLGSGTGQFMLAANLQSPLASSLMSILVGDFNDDQTLDLLGVSTNSVFVFLGKGGGAFAMLPIVSELVTTAATQAATIGDFNGDHYPDLAIAHCLQDQARVRVLLGNGTGGFAATESYALPFSATNLIQCFIATGDVDEDSRPDLAVAVGGFYTLEIGVLRNLSQ